MSELNEKVKASIERLKAFEPRNGEGYYLAFSGGKDSVVIKALADLAGVKYDAHYRVTSVDPPELVQFIKEKHPDVSRDVTRYKEDEKNPKLAGKPITMWNLIPKKRIPPTRLYRFCCAWLKEAGGDGRKTVTGVRWAESPARKKNQGIATIMSQGAQKNFRKDDDFSLTKRGVVLVNDNTESRRTVEQCYKRHKTNINPIIDWTEKDVWEFIRTENIPYCGLYDCGFKRLGCIGCPMADTKGRMLEFAVWPKYKGSYLLAFEKMLRERTAAGLSNNGRFGETPQDVFNWWMQFDILPGQTAMDLAELEEDGE